MMKNTECKKCGKRALCYIGTVYFARILIVTQTTQYRALTTQTNTITRYSMPEKKEIPICSECIIKDKKLKLILIPITLLITLFIICAFTEFEPIVLYASGGIWLVVLGIIVTKLITKKYQKRIRSNDVYILAREQLEKQFKQYGKDKYAYWPSYPSHLKNG